MSFADHARRILVASGLMAVTLSVVLDGHFATDNTTTVPAPASLALLTIGGVAGVAAALIRRRKK